jgi:hypothetical protein
VAAVELGPGTRVPVENRSQIEGVRHCSLPGTSTGPWTRENEWFYDVRGEKTIGTRGAPAPQSNREVWGCCTGSKTTIW